MSRHTWILSGIVAVALILRLVMMFAAESYEFASDWKFGYEYGSIAKWVAMGEGFSSPYDETPQPSAMMPPLYVYFGRIFQLGDAI